MIFWVLSLSLISTPFLMAQSNLIHLKKQLEKVSIIYTSTDASASAKILFSHLEQATPETFELSTENKKKYYQHPNHTGNTKNNKELNDQAFIIKSDATTIRIIANNTKTLQQGVYTLLEFWEFRKFTTTVSYVPKPDEFTFPKISIKYTNLHLRTEPYCTLIPMIKHFANGTNLSGSLMTLVCGPYF